MRARIKSFFARHLVSDATEWWRWWSLRLMALAAFAQAIALASPDALLAAWQNLPPDLRAILPARVGDLVPLGLTVAAIIARHVKQAPPPERRA